MKKMISLGGVAVLCLLFLTKIAGQTPTIKKKAPITALSIGDKLPNIIFEDAINSRSGTINTKSLFGKAIVFDFWASWCTNCIQGFPHLEEMQSKYQKNLQIILVNNSDRDSRAAIVSLFEDRKADGFQVSIPSLRQKRILEQLFPHRALPHYVLIGPDGRVKAITEEVTEENVKRLIAGLELNLKTKIR
ncbi:TlpA disulfide reductase family protein [Pedobacter sp. Leaf250]|uniref:TlpA family protein disulfide reductase n=1 Tax=Pedobacter sp. Leaf250 TaxID=2876559 RepID=UPI001E4CDB63|nr:TlpA disulfide reductase family protein [Pedobacter sp. Leaf250]